MKRNRKLTMAIFGVAILSLVLAACSLGENEQAARSAPLQPAAPALAVPAAPAPQSRADSTRPAQPANALAVQAAPAAPAPAAPVPAAPAPVAAPAPTAVESQSAPVVTLERSTSLYAATGASAPAGTPAPSVSGVPAPDGGFGFSTGGTATVNDAPYDATFFKHYGVNPFIDTVDDHFSTFAMDVDTASYTVARRFIQDGFLPDPDAVRVEEFVNFFDQGYESPDEGAFAINIEGAPSPFGGENQWLMRVGLQGRQILAEDRKDASLVFVIDVSGSMARENRLELVKRSLSLLVEQLRPTDEVGIVVYGSRAFVVLEPTSGANKDTILEAIDSLAPHGSTNAAEGLLLGYRMAIETVQPAHISRVILLSDGVANVGRTGSDSILETVRQYVEEEVTLSTVGFGMGNYNDILMEQLANDGNGNYSYVDTLSEARRIFVENLTGTLQVIARDAKVQVEFNPEVVSRYRLLGYENRDVADRDFRNDAIDAGEVGAGHNVTALYELKLHEDAEGPIGTVFVRYQDPDTFEVNEINREFFGEELYLEFEEASPRFQLATAVAEYAEILRESFWAKESNLLDVLLMAQNLGEMLPEDTRVAEFIQLVEQAERIARRG